MTDQPQLPLTNGAKAEPTIDTAQAEATDIRAPIEGEVVANGNGGQIVKHEPPAPQAISVYDSLQAARDWPALLTLADALARSRIGVPNALKSPEQIAAVLLAGNEYGMGPMEALQKLHVVNGKIGMDASEMRARIYRNIAGATIEVVELADHGCTLRGTRPGKPPMEASFTAEDATTAGLAGKDNYRHYAQDMYFARATSRLARRYFADAFRGIAYTPDELGETPPSPSPDADPNAPNAPTRQQRQAGQQSKTAERERICRVYDEWLKAAKAYWGAHFRKAPERFKAWVDSLAGREVFERDWTGEFMQQCLVQLGESRNPEPINREPAEPDLPTDEANTPF